MPARSAATSGRIIAGERKARDHDPHFKRNSDHFISGNHRVKRTFLTECPKLEPFQTCLEPSRNFASVPSSDICSWSNGAEIWHIAMPAGGSRPLHHKRNIDNVQNCLRTIAQIARRDN